MPGLGVKNHDCFYSKKEMLNDFKNLRKPKDEKEEIQWQKEKRRKMQQ